MKEIIFEQFSLFTPNNQKLFGPISLKITEGSKWLLTGPNGIGKSTLLKTLTNEWPHFRGQLQNPFVNFAYLPQIENISLHIPFTLKDVIDIELNKKVSLEQISALGFLPPQKLPLAWNSASGGERKRALLTRFFLKPSEVLFLDEPFNHLDLKTVELLVKKLESDELKNKTILMILHDKKFINPTLWNRFDLEAPHASAL
jgi:ATPase subunit of ABC transporter with duplicated ATPase domains